MVRRKPNQRRDLPAIDIRTRQIKTLLGRKKTLIIPKKEQREIKARLIRQYPDRYFIDDLNEYNSVKEEDKLDWIDEIEAFEALIETDTRKRRASSLTASRKKNTV